jgi:hypothetical protein
MGMRPQLTLLMLTALFGVMNPPGRPPGSPPESARMMPCSHDSCSGWGKWQSNSKYRYDCDERDHSFYYCYKCKEYLEEEQVDGHQHETT